MPYIKPMDRVTLDRIIDAFLEDLETMLPDLKVNSTSEVTRGADLVGHLNYAVTRIVMGALKLVSERPKYETLALFSGLFSHMGAEFYRRVVVPYEEKKIAKNGDLMEFKNGGGVVMEQV